MKPVPVALSPVLISSGDRELLSWLVVVQEVTKNKRKPNKTKKRDKSLEPYLLASALNRAKFICIHNRLI